MQGARGCNPLTSTLASTDFRSHKSLRPYFQGAGIETRASPAVSINLEYVYWFVLNMSNASSNGRVKKSPACCLDPLQGSLRLILGQP
jgi:hypothetical protein